MEAKWATGAVLGRLLWLALIASLGSGAPSRAAESTSGGAGAVRALQERGAKVLTRGARLSTTFKRLLQEIAQSDVVVYIDLDPYDERTLDGVLQFVGTAGGVRYVKVWLRVRRTDDEIIVTLAHELRHAVEVAQAREVTSQASLARFYLAVGRSDNPGRFETRAAQETAAQVAAELRRRDPEGPRHDR
jgi:hypothetical protein